MFDSLKQWIRFPVTIYKAGGTTVAGDISYVASYVKGYLVEETRNMVDDNGAEFVSYASVYLLPETVVAAGDSIALRNDTVKRRIKKVGGYFDGNTGRKSITVVYL